MIGSSHKARTPAVETTAISINLPAFAAPEMDVPQKRGGEVNNDRTPGRRDAAQGIGSHGARGPIGRMYRPLHLQRALFVISGESMMPWNTTAPCSSSVRVTGCVMT